MFHLTLFKGKDLNVHKYWVTSIILSMVYIMWKQEHASLLERQVADLNIKMAAVLALVSLYGCIQTAQYEHACLQTLLSVFCSQQTLGGSGVAHGSTVMSRVSHALQSACHLCHLHLLRFQRQVIDSISHGRPGVFGLWHWDTTLLVIHRPLPSHGEGCGVSILGEFCKLHLC